MLLFCSDDIQMISTRKAPPDAINNQSSSTIKAVNKESEHDNADEKDEFVEKNRDEDNGDDGDDALITSEFDEEDELDEEPDAPTNALLATLSKHEKAVNCVRWSPDGKILASAGADNVIYLWACWQKSADENLFSQVEAWSAILVFQGHEADIIDLAWAPQSNRLASCSLDTTVMIWDVRSAVLKHQV